MQYAVYRRWIKKIKPKSPVVVVGFPGAGLVGSLALAQYTDAEGSEFVGYMESEELAPLASIHNYMPLPAVRIHYIKQHNTVVLFSEMTIPVKLSFSFADEIISLAKELKAKMVVSVGGIVMSTPKPLFYVASNPRLFNQLKNIGTPIKEGATTGITALLLLKGSNLGLDVVSLLAHVTNDYLDPGAAVRVLRGLSKVIGKKIDTAELEKEDALLKKQTKDRVVKSKLLEKKMSDLSMYG